MVEEKVWSKEDKTDNKIYDYIVIGSGMGGMTAAALLKNNPNPTKSDIRNSMHINLCRCATYNRIEKAV